jgi:phospholipase/carboxylesterase
MKRKSSGLVPLALFWAMVIGLGLPLAVTAQTKRPKGKRVVPAPVLTAPPPVISIDTVGTWHHIEQRRLGRYKISLPPGYQANGRRYPMVLLLHGNGNTPQMLLNWFAGLKLDSVIVVCPEAPYVKIPETVERRQGAYTAVADAIGAPDTIRGESIELTARWYADVLENARQTLRVDTMRPAIIVGFSQGGYFAHVLMTLLSDKVSGVASICASLYPQWDVQSRFVSVPQPRPRIFVAHAVADPIVPYSIGESYRGALQSAGFSIEFLPFEGGHWPTPAVDAALRAWIVSIIG